MPRTYQGTTHTSPHGGSGRPQRQRPFARSIVAGVKKPGKMAPWFLKQWGSRPESKRPRRLAEVA